MKKILITTNLLLLAAAIFFACNGPVVNAVSHTKISDDCSELCMNYTDVPWEGKINQDIARTIANKYKEDRAKSFIWNGTEITDNKDSRAIWFPLETLKRYIWDIERQQCIHKCKDSLGLRIYFARYPNKQDAIWNSDMMEPVEGYQDRHTLFMVPTYWTGTFNQDFDPWVGCRLVRGPSGDSISKKAILFIDAQNHGGLIPPDPEDGMVF